MKLYTKRSCPYCHRVELALVERKISPELMDFEQIDFSNLSENFLNINPNKTVPTLEFFKGNGFAESMIIVEYLDSLDAVGGKLYGDQPDEIAKIKFQMELLDKKVTSFLRNVTFTFGNKIQEEKLFLETPQVFSFLEEMLGKNNGHFLGGDHLNALDIQVIPFVLRYVAMTLLRSNWIMPEKNTRVSQYFKDVIAHPSVQKSLPGLEEVSTFVKRHTSQADSIQKIKNASRDLIKDVSLKLDQLNQAVHRVPFSWVLSQNDKGPFLTCKVVFSTPQQVIKALGMLHELQENSDHHCDFKLDHFATMTVEVCTHQPKWGVTEVDLAFAEVLTQQIRGILNEK